MKELRQSDLTARVYKLLSSVFLKQPDNESLSLILTWCSGLLISRNQLPSSITTALNLIKNSLEIEKGISEDYVRLIRTPSSSNSPFPPYESVYLEGSLWGLSTVEVLKKYRKQGLEPIGKYHGEPPDHIGLELYFMSSLCEKEGKITTEKNLKELQKIELEFLEDHLTKWFSLYLKSALKYKPHKFYEGVFKLTNEWINLHREHLSRGV